MGREDVGVGVDGAIAAVAAGFAPLTWWPHGATGAVATVFAIAARFAFGTGTAVFAITPRLALDSTGPTGAWATVSAFFPWLPFRAWTARFAGMSRFPFWPLGAARTG